MPNWVKNVIRFECSDEKRDEIIKAITTQKSKRYCFYGLKCTFNGQVDFNREIDFKKIVPIPEDEKWYNENWYDWNCTHWGTKWNARETHIDNEVIEFETAWCAPMPILSKLSEKYPDIEFDHKFADEDIGGNFGHYIWKNGLPDEQLDSQLFVEEYSKGALDFAFDVWGAKPEDWNLKLNKDGTKYIVIGEEEEK